MAAQFEVILLDADDTLFDFRRAESEAFARTMKAHGFPHDAETLQAYRRINEGLWRELEQGNVTQSQIKAERFTRLFRELGIEADGPAMNEAYLEELADGAFLLPGAEELCRTLSEHARLFIATNGIGFVQHRRLERSTIRPYIEDIFISEEMGAGKPSPAYYETLLSRISNCPERDRILMVGDSLSSDMQGGRNAQLTTCWFHPGGDACAHPELCDYTITRLEDLSKIVDGSI